MNKIMIIGSPHSGTSILKTIIGKHKSVHSHDGESFEPKERHIQGMINLQKYPMMAPELNLNHLKDYKTIFLIREPDYCLRSLRERFKDVEVPDDHKQYFHKEYWQWLMSSYLACGYIKMRYQDIFNPRKLEEMFDKLDLKCPISPYGTYERKLFKDSIIPKEKPDPRDHVNFRMWQLNQPIMNKNLETTIPDAGEFTELQELICYKLIFGEKS
jgi:hypothetical protein